MEGANLRIEQDEYDCHIDEGSPTSDYGNAFHVMDTFAIVHVSPAVVGPPTALQVRQNVRRGDDTGGEYTEIDDDM
jgi:hypothetical protein